MKRFEFAIDRTLPEPLHRQVYEMLRSAILKGALAAGSRLPSTRALAKQLRVSRNTVLYAYETLSVEGLLVSKTGSGTRVCDLRGSKIRFIPVKLDFASVLRDAHYPSTAVEFGDPDGNSLYVHR